MESFLFSKEKMNRCRKKVIPWHVQQRYMESFSQLSLNQTISAAMYKKKIKSLQRNNKHLALALQRSRYLATEKENLLIDSGKILDIINFSRVKLMDMAINMKQATECLDETLLLLNSSLTDSLSKHSPCNLNYRNDFKNKLQEISRNSPIEEVSESLDSPNVDVQSYARKGKISRVDGSVSSPNKKCKLTKKGRPDKRCSKDMPKSAEESSSTTSTTSSKNVNLNTSKCGSALSVKSQNRKKSSQINSNIKSSSSSKVSKSTSSKRFFQTKTKQECLDKKRKAVKVILTDIAEAFLTQETENYHSPVKNEPTSPNRNFKYFTPNSPEDDILIKKYFSSELSYQPKNSASNSFGSQFATIDDDGIPDCSQSTSNSSNLSCSDIPEIDEKSPALSSQKKEDFVCGQNNAIVKIEQVEKSDNITKQNNGSYIKKTYSEKDKKSNKSHSLKVINRVPLYYDEDAIEKVEGNAVASKDRIRKTINKCKARKTVSHKKKNIPSESTALKSNVIFSDNISKLGKNSFLVTAEVHSPPNGIYIQEIKSKMCASENMEPCVVLTDIFKSNQSLLSEMVGDGLHENECLKKTIIKPAVAPLAEINATYAVNRSSYNECYRDAYNDCEYTVGEDPLLEGRFLGNKVFCQERIKESKNICKKQPLVVLRDIINCGKDLNKCCKVNSNKKNGITFMPYLSHDKEK
ncbi:unnamed protein product [Larinioides sclopetarius]|uniref:Shugoshin C-terminal domain-containing protein n=1 Tax=Larinioides sclopetarius TaxID=280406 RepID=A0AAV1Z3J4_9ARAC